jgi:hypothetical protein
VPYHTLAHGDLPLVPHLTFDDLDASLSVE